MQFTPLAVPGVKSGATPLITAYEAACKEKERQESDEAKFERLQMKSPDLAAMVQEGQLMLAGALAELDAREAERKRRENEERERLQRASSHFDRILGTLEPNSCDPEEHAKSFLTLKPDLVGGGVAFSAERARRAAKTLLRYAEYKDKEQNNG